MQSALNNTAGVTDLKMPGQRSLTASGQPLWYASAKFEGQLIQYTGTATAEDVIAILHKKTSFKITVGAAPKEEEVPQLMAE